MSKERFTQEQVNRIVAMRVKRERERLAKEFERSLKRCMASIHQQLHQEMCAMKRDFAAETKDVFSSGPDATLRPDDFPFQKSNSGEQPMGGGERQ